jgi:phenylacetic acid degradation operon negative regulatory protein
MSLKRPQDLVFTLFGEYLTPLDRPVWAGSLIALLKPFRISEGAVRTVLSRMTRKGWLHSRRVGRHSYYALTARGRRVVEAGKARLFHPPSTDSWDGRWCLVIYSIPEGVRHLRDRLRVRLSWLGFGSLGNGVWVSPHDVVPQVTEVAREMELGGNLVCFRADQVIGEGHAGLVERCWSLPDVAARYRTFLGRWQAETERLGSARASEGLSDDRAFVLRFRLIHEYREFPLVDPFLPDILLPDEWPGKNAAEVFSALHEQLVAPSDRYVSAVLAREPTSRGRSRAAAHGP